MLQCLKSASIKSENNLLFKYFVTNSHSLIAKCLLRIAVIYKNSIIFRKSNAFSEAEVEKLAELGSETTGHSDDPTVTDTDTQSTQVGGGENGGHALLEPGDQSSTSGLMTLSCIANEQSSSVLKTEDETNFVTRLPPDKHTSLKAPSVSEQSPPQPPTPEIPSTVPTVPSTNSIATSTEYEDGVSSPEFSSSTDFTCDSDRPNPNLSSDVLHSDLPDDTMHTEGDDSTSGVELMSRLTRLLNTDDEQSFDYIRQATQPQDLKEATLEEAAVVQDSGVLEVIQTSHCLPSDTISFARHGLTNRVKTKAILLRGRLRSQTRTYLLYEQTLHTHRLVT